MNLINMVREQTAVNRARMKKNHPGLYKWCWGPWAWVVEVIALCLLIWRWSVCGF